MKKLAVFFPGAGYSMDCPLLYYADFLLETFGFERQKLNYQEILLQKELPLEVRINQLRTYIDMQIEMIDFHNYEEVIFVAKSIGCTEAGLIADKYLAPLLPKSSLKFQQIFMTPVVEALPFCNSNCRVIIGTNDKAYTLFKTHCDVNAIPLLSIEGGDHSLELARKPFDSIETLKKVMEYFTCFI